MRTKKHKPFAFALDEQSTGNRRADFRYLISVLADLADDSDCYAPPIGAGMVGQDANGRWTIDLQIELARGA